MDVCDAREADCFGTQLVHSAAQGGCIAIMEDLVKHGHDLTAVNNTSRTCLHYAARGKHANRADKACPGHSHAQGSHWVAYWVACKCHQS